MGLRLLAEPGCAIFKVPFGWIAAAYGPVPGSGLANRNLAALFCPEAPVPTPNPGADCPEPPEPAPELELPLPELPDPELPLFELPDPEPDGPLPELGPVPFPLFDECELLVLAQFARNKVEVRISARANNCRTCDIRPPKDREPEFELLDECSAVQRLPVALAGSGFQTPSLSIEKRKGAFRLVVSTRYFHPSGHAACGIEYLCRESWCIQERMRPVPLLLSLPDTIFGNLPNLLRSCHSSHGLWAKP